MHFARVKARGSRFDPRRRPNPEICPEFETQMQVSSLGPAAAECPALSRPSEPLTALGLRASASIPSVKWAHGYAVQGC